MLTPSVKEVLLDHQLDILNGIKSAVIDSLEDNVEFVGFYTAGDEKSFKDNVVNTIKDYLLNNFSTLQRWEVDDIMDTDIELLCPKTFFNKENYYENYQN